MTTTALITIAVITIGYVLIRIAGLKTKKRNDTSRTHRNERME